MNLLSTQQSLQSLTYVARLGSLGPFKSLPPSLEEYLLIH